MSDLEFLFILLGAFYLWESAGWVRRGGVAFVRGWGKSFRVAPLLGNLRGGFAIALPLPPMGAVTVASQLPVSLSADGALAYVATVVNPGGRHAQTGRFIRWEDIQNVAAKGKSIRVNGAQFVQAQSTYHARWLAGQLRSLAKLEPEKRAAAIASLIQNLFDADALKKRCDDFASRAKPVRLLSNVLFVFVFIIAPLVVWRLGIVATWQALVAGLFTLTGITMILFHRAHLALHPDAGDERFSQCLMVLLYSPAAMRASDALSRPLLENFHPLTVASVLCDGKNFHALARQLLRDLRFPALPLATDDQPQLAAIEKTTRALTLAAAEALVKKSGINPDDLMRAPQPLDATCRACCPRCHAQFTAVEATCSDCGGMPSVPLAAR